MVDKEYNATKKDLNTCISFDNRDTRGREEQSSPTQWIYNRGNRGREEQSSPTQWIISKKLMIFIDGENLFQFCRENKIKLDYKKLINLLSLGYDLIRVYYYTGIPTKNMWNRNKENQKDFEDNLDRKLHFLENLELEYHFEVVKKPLAVSNGKIMQKGVDVRIASDIIWHGLSNNYDAFVLISGDKDLMDCLIRMKDNGKKVIVANFEGKISRELKKIADKYVNLSKYLNEIKLEE